MTERDDFRCKMRNSQEVALRLVESNIKKAQSKTFKPSQKVSFDKFAIWKIFQN